jgi:hypothetical protein
MPRGRSSLLALVALEVLAAACGAAQPLPRGPEAAEPAGGDAGGSNPPRAESAVSGAPEAPPSSSGVAAPPSAPSPQIEPGAARVEMMAPSRTAFVGELQALGLDPSSLPAIEKLEPKALRGAMKLFAKSLGIKCADCHQEGDFAAPTRRKKIAARMWNEFAAKLSLADGSPLFCDSCHRGRTRLLDRRDKQSLSHWMDANFVAGLARKNGATHDCETCHVDMDMTFLAAWGR